MTTQALVPQLPSEADRQAMLSELVAFINRELVVEDDIEAVDADTPLLEMGILDSLAMVSLLAFVESDFGSAISQTVWGLRERLAHDDTDDGRTWLWLP